MNKLEICNSAIIRLGSSPIDSLDDNNKRAKLCKIEYPRVKKELLANHPWRFALKREVLSDDNGPDEFGVWGNSFDLPFDYIRSYRVGNSGNSTGIVFFDDCRGGPEASRYTIEGNILFANTTSIDLNYMADVDEDAFRSYFDEVIILKIALDLSYNLIQSNDTTARLQAQYDDALRNARSYNAQEASTHDFVVRDWTDSRL